MISFQKAKSIVVSGDYHELRITPWVVGGKRKTVLTIFKLGFRELTVRPKDVAETIRWYKSRIKSLRKIEKRRNDSHKWCRWRACSYFRIVLMQTGKRAKHFCE